MNSSRRLLPLAVLLSAAVLCPAPVAGASEPAGYEHLHTYAEVKAEIDAVVATHPTIAARFSMGISYEGRQIWGIKISDNVATDEAEPEVFVNGQIHARERQSGEMALYLIDLLASGYGFEPRITRLVDTREIWIVPMVNPDGAEYDMSDGVFRNWRKNRQPIAGSSEVGVDLNRQFGFKWACCGGASNDPWSDYFRGFEPWSAPEVRAYRNFVDSRLIGGRQQITEILSLHAAGRLVLWPYAYTAADHPRTMRYDDWRTFVALGRKVAAQNGYRPMQSSSMYVDDGDMDDWAYHEHRIFAITIELARGSPRRGAPTLPQLQADQERNKPALLLYLEYADCPYRAARLAGRHCVAG